MDKVMRDEREFLVNLSKHMFNFDEDYSKLINMGIIEKYDTKEPMNSSFRTNICRKCHSFRKANEHDAMKTVTVTHSMRKRKSILQKSREVRVLACGSCHFLEILSPVEEVDKQATHKKFTLGNFKRKKELTLLEKMADKNKKKKKKKCSSILTARLQLNQTKFT
eukprot:maker-scaffold_11-snap-gene-5.5-mRNA-1 protein AED:0.00 eAED:0.00 QI:67/1/1/1/0/0/2/338/164